MFWNVLTSASDSIAEKPTDWSAFILLALLFVGMIAFMFISSRKQKKRQQEVADMRNAIKPGNKVTTIGGIVGTVVEVNEEENTFVLVTGSEKSGKSFMRFDKQAIYTTDAVAKKEEEKKEAKETKEEVKEAEETQTEEKTEE